MGQETFDQSQPAVVVVGAVGVENVTPTDGATVVDDVVAKPCQPLSGHTKFQKAQFAICIISPMVCGSVLFFGKDIYILKLGADVGFMGAVGTILAIWGPLCPPLTGYCMDKDLFGRWFPWKIWGRRAPWYMTHLIGAAFVSAMVFVPPSFESSALCWWFLCLGCINCWCLGVVFNCFEAGRAEIYPTKEERSEVEAMTKIAAGLGTALGTGPQLFLAARATQQIMAVVGVCMLASGLLSLFSLRVLCTARQVCDPSYVGSLVGEIVDLLRIPAFRHLVAYRFFEGLLLSTALAGALYYLTFVDGLFGDDRSLWVLGLGMVVGVVTIIALPMWTQFFRFRRQGVNTNRVCGSVASVGLLAAPLLLVLRPLVPAPVGFICYCVLMQATLTGQTFWRMIALGWVIDEDCHVMQGRRREALFTGALSCFGSIGGALAVGSVLTGLAWSGLKVINCEEACTDDAMALLNTTHTTDECILDCEQLNIVRQPAAVRAYAELLYFAFVPVYQVICVVLCFTFPIHGKRLDALYANQARLLSAPTPSATVKPSE